MPCRRRSGSAISNDAARAIASTRASSSPGSHETRRADQERGNLHVEVAVMGEVVDNRLDFGGLQRSALDLVPDSIEAFRRVARAHGDERPDSSAKRRNAGSERPVRPGQPTRPRQSGRCKAGLRRPSQLDPAKPRKTSGCSALSGVKSPPPFSRPVSRLTRRIFSCGRLVFGFVSSAMTAYQCENRSEAAAATACSWSRRTDELAPSREWP